MPTAASFIEALQRRLRLAPRRAPGELPPGWQHWLDEMPARADAVTGATPEAVLAVLAQRPLAQPPARAAALNRWQAFATLWRQEWHPPAREERGLRWFAGSTSLLWHLIFGGLLIWLMYLQYFATRPPARGEDVTLVELIGDGTPQRPGGGPQQPSEQPGEQAAEPTPTQTQAPPQAAAAEPAPPQPDVPTPPAPELQAAVPEVPQRDVPEPQLPPPTAEQPVMVSKALPDAPQEFVLPPTRRRVDDSVRVPQLEAAARPVPSQDVPAPVQPIARELPQRDIAAPSLSARPREIALREVPAPTPAPALPSVNLPSRPISAPQLRSVTPSVRVADIPTPNPPAPAARSAAPASSAPAAATPVPSKEPAFPASAADAAAALDAAASAPSAAARAPAATAGAGPKPTPAPGTWSSPKRGDDWGEAARNRPGGQPGQPGQAPGLYGSDGRVRLAETPGSASPGQPPGTITEEIKDLDRAGTWLRRKPNDYEPTTFDKYWRPNETLLAEWVRRSVQTVMIPIPGTSKRIRCSVVLLMAGGGCGINDPNLNDQPAEARPPPDVPFKPHLQEDNGSVRPPPGG
ncbi:hypothetical protein ABU614_16490 [Lysobacter firmicutimachus]|uniref:Transmembrane repetitive protein n=1 Tax=Lysobacter firmicutimachus TaxID=1792846 RepID=A0AAU8MPK3_9GAMM